MIEKRVFNGLPLGYLLCLQNVSKLVNQLPKLLVKQLAKQLTKHKAEVPREERPRVYTAA